MTTNAAEKPQADFVVAVDIGTTTIRVAAALVSASGDSDENAKPAYIDLAGYCSVPSTGMSQTGITSMDKLRESLSTAYNKVEAQMRANINVKDYPDINFDNPHVMVSVPGYFMVSKNNEGLCDIGGQLVDAHHMDEAQNVANALKIPNYEMITSIANYFQVDTNEFMEDPRNAIGGQLKTFVHSCYARTDFLENIKMALSFIPTNDDITFVFSGLATAFSVLSDEEKKQGVCLLDIGGSTDIVIYNNGYLIFTGFSKAGAVNVTNNIAITNGIARGTAEQVKLRYGYADPELAPANEGIKFPAKDQRESFTLECKDLAETIDSCYTSIFLNAFRCMKDVHNCSLGAGVVLAGSGSKIKGVDSCFKRVLKDNKIDGEIRLVKTGYVRDQINYLGKDLAIDKVGDACVIGLFKFSTLMERKRATPRGKGILGFFKKIYYWYNNSM